MIVGLLNPNCNPDESFFHKFNSTKDWTPLLNALLETSYESDNVDFHLKSNQIVQTILLESIVCLIECL